MRIIIDEDRCQGHARCAAAAPELYLLNSDGHIAVDGFTPEPGQEALARRGVRACPERVITIED